MNEWYYENNKKKLPVTKAKLSLLLTTISIFGKVEEEEEKKQNKTKQKQKQKQTIGGISLNETNVFLVFDNKDAFTLC